jgi:hypothetical protein
VAECPVCNGLGYIEYETGVEHGGVVDSKGYL